MDVKYVNPFLSGVVEVLGTMAGVALEAGKPYLKQQTLAEGDISGVIGLSGDAQGSLAVTFHFGLIQAVMRGMLGDEISAIDDAVRDAVGELTNMISGAARRELSEKGLGLRAGIPRIYDGHGHCIEHAASPVLAVPFSSEYGYAVIEVALR